MAQPIDVQTGLADLDTGRMYYEVAGAGPVLVLAHAGIADRTMWDDQFLVFAQQFRVVRFDFWGFGKSTPPNAPFALHQDLRQLLAVLGIEQAHVLGCSLGGRVAIDLALTYPGLVRSLIVVGSGLSGYEFTGEALDQFSKDMRAAHEAGDPDLSLELVIRLWVDGRGRSPDQVDGRIRERVRAMLKGNAGWPVAEQPLDPPAIGRLAEITAPTLILLGDRDEANIGTIAALLAANIAGARLTLLPDTAHLPNMEQPERFNRAVLEFLHPLD